MSLFFPLSPKTKFSHSQTFEMLCQNSCICRENSAIIKLKGRKVHIYENERRNFEGNFFRMVIKCEKITSTKNPWESNDITYLLTIVWDTKKGAHTRGRLPFILFFFPFRTHLDYQIFSFSYTANTGNESGGTLEKG